MSSKYSNSELYKSKYLKYKAKYINLKNMHGGGVEEDVEKFLQDLKEANSDIKETIEELINRAVFRDGELIDLKLFNLDIKVLPSSILNLNIKEDLHLENNNNLNTFPENFDKIKVGKNIYSYGIINEALLVAIQKIKKNQLYKSSPEEIKARNDQEARKAEETRKTEEARKAKDASWFGSFY